MLRADTRSPGPRTVCPCRAVETNEVEGQSRRTRSVSRRRRIGRCLARRLRVPGCSVAGRGAFRTTNPDGRLVGVSAAVGRYTSSLVRRGRAAGTVVVGTAAGTVVAGVAGGEEGMGSAGQEVGVRPSFRLLSRTGAAPC